MASDRPLKRKYRSGLAFVESGFAACRENIADLVSASKHLLEGGFHATALSLAVLALEEAGKLMLLDGLLFARHEDYKSEAFRRGAEHHPSKLDALELFPMLLGVLAQSDPRAKEDQRFATALVITMQNLKTDRQALEPWLGTDGFVALDRWKQRGLYSYQSGGAFVSPAEAVDSAPTAAVHRLACAAARRSIFSSRVARSKRTLHRRVQSGGR